MSDYEQKALSKVKLVLDAAEANGACQQDIRLETTGSDPSLRVTIPAYLLRKFLKAPGTAKE